MDLSAVALKAIRALRHWSDERLDSLAHSSRWLSVARGDVVYSPGDRGDCVYFVISGTLKETLSKGQSGVLILSRLSQGDIFGDVDVFVRRLRTTKVVATESCGLLSINESCFREYLLSDQEVSFHLMRSIAERLRLANERIGSLSRLDAADRVARFLVESSADENGTQFIPERISKQEIANTIGASREHVSRIFKEFQEQGLIREIDGRLAIEPRFVKSY